MFIYVPKTLQKSGHKLENKKVNVYPQILTSEFFCFPWLLHRILPAGSTTCFSASEAQTRAIPSLAISAIFFDGKGSMLSSMKNSGEATISQGFSNVSSNQRSRSSFSPKTTRIPRGA